MHNIYDKSIFRNNLDELLTRLDQEEDTTTDTAGASSTNVGSVYGSSAQMFVFIKNSIKRCTVMNSINL